MRFSIVTVLPEVLESFTRTGVLGRAITAGLVELEIVNPRDHAPGKHRSTDDAPYGGGSGMVMMPGPLVLAMEAIEARSASRPLRVLLTPQGEPYTQRIAHELSALPAVTLVCGRYEGLDERARRACDRELSIGDFVLMGGEVAAMAVVESVARLLPGVLGNAGSLDEESHARGRLEYPHYTRPAVFRDQAVPDALVSGHHAEVARWRKKESLRRTRARRPDLLAAFPPDAEEKALLAELDAEEKAP